MSRFHNPNQEMMMLLVHLAVLVGLEASVELNEYVRTQRDNNVMLHTTNSIVKTGE